MKKRIVSLFEPFISYSWWVYLLTSVLGYMIVCTIVNHLPTHGNMTDPSLFSVPFVTIIFPCFVFLAGGFFWFQWARKRLLSNQLPIKQLNRMDIKSFCDLITQRFSFMGYTLISQTYDNRRLNCLIKLIKDGEMALVMVRRDKRIKFRQIQDLIDLKFTEGIKHGIFVTTGIYQALAAVLSKRSSIELIDGKKLMLLIGKHVDDKCLLAQRHHDGFSDLNKITSWIESHKPICPHCQSPLIMKLKGNTCHPGRTYWECTFHPECHGTFDYDIDHKDMQRK